MLSELASNQTSTGWSIEVEKEERIGDRSGFHTRSARLRVSSYRSRIQRLSRPSLTIKVIAILPSQHDLPTSVRLCKIMVHIDEMSPGHRNDENSIPWWVVVSRI